MNLKEYLKKNNISYRKFAKEAGVHYSSISYILSGRNKSISLDIASKIIKASKNKITVEELLEEVKTGKALE